MFDKSIVHATLKRVLAWGGGLIVSVTIVLVLGTNLDQFFADKIKEVRQEKLSSVLVQRAILTAKTIDFEQAPVPEYQQLLNIYGRQLANSSQVSQTNNQPFRIAPIAFRHRAEVDSMIVFWPRQCVNDGCRYDLVGATAIQATLVGVNPRRTDVFINGYMVFVNADGRFFVHNGKDYELVQKPSDGG